MYSVCSFKYMLVDSFWAFLSFWALILVEFLLLHWKVVFTSARFFLTADVFHGILGLALCFVGMYSAAYVGIDEVLIFVIAISVSDIVND